MAHSLSTGDSPLFYARSPVQIGQTKLALGVARNLMALTGNLPIVQSEGLVIKPKIETMCISELNATGVARLSVAQVAGERRRLTFS